MRNLGVIWSAAGLLMAIDSRSIIEVLPPVSCRPLPGGPPWVRGLFSYRGGLIPLVDAASLLGGAAGGERAVDRMANRVVVVRVAAGTAGVEWPIGIWVERILEIERIDFDAPGGHPGLATEAGRFLGPVTQTRWGQVQLLNPAELFTPEQAAVLTARLTEGAA